MLYRHLAKINDKIIKGLRRYGAPKKKEGYVRIKVPSLRELARGR